MASDRPKSGTVQEAQNQLVLSYLTVRQALGWIGLLLPVALILGGMGLNGRVYPSISDSYYSPMKDVFVGALAAIGVFLIAYRGYDRKPGEIFSDTWVSRLAGAAAIGVALMPTTPDDSLLAQELSVAPDASAPYVCSLMQCLEGPRLTSQLHFACAGLFFALLAVFCLVLFPRSGGRAHTRGKRRANRLYRVCGGILVLVLLAVAILFAVGSGLSPAQSAALRGWNLLFWLESIGVWAFGLSWLVKGKSIGPLRIPYFTNPAPAKDRPPEQP